MCDDIQKLRRDSILRESRRYYVSTLLAEGSIYLCQYSQHIDNLNDFTIVCMVRQFFFLQKAACEHKGI